MIEPTLEEMTCMKSECESDFHPSINCNSPGSWTAAITLPVVGNVAVTAYTWQEARLKLWLVACAVEKTMRGVMSPSK